jgi:hypothetical protein
MVIGFGAGRHRQPAPTAAPGLWLLAIAVISEYFRLARQFI